ncbi:EPIDERMAL PATTERNING FACTOR-like protein 1 [Gastrolobium bilobum]|uniref:EPIDERMAL PATTERNING FACTOR-like protein 1 n=1 Tax=Gastrolobium bilobum TaxID=150636 RepID=UPI002AB2E82F|nr:EPIDERMAL PATTERNING FACTOR-like protein 1 [Gastrolobium bilobum]
MASLNSYYNFTILLIIVLVNHLMCSVSCFNQPQPAIPSRDLLYEEENRLGSIPPRCHNKCNQCHPCMAVQVPDLPSHERVQPDLAMESFFLQGNRYSNYKPLSWKCHCGGHFFNP